MIRKFIIIYLALTATTGTVLAEDDWRETSILHAYLQTYGGSTNRQLTFSAGAYLNYDYLDSGGFGFGYNYTFTDFDYNAELTEHLVYLTGRHHIYSDILPGKLTLRLDAYFGEDTLRYNINNPPGHTGGGGMGNRTAGGSSEISESADITAFQPQIAFINYAKTLYLDLGYARSEYDGAVTTKVAQLTPTVGFGWNDSYDWLQFRGYIIQLNEPVTSSGDDQFDSLEIKYTHWLAENASSMEFWRLTVITGDRLFAVDSDAAVIYSTADIQNGSLLASAQWKLSSNTKLLSLIEYTQYENESTGDDYDSLLVYLNLQKQW